MSNTTKLRVGQFIVDVTSWDDGDGGIEAQATVWTNPYGAPWSLGQARSQDRPEAECLAALAAIRAHRERKLHAFITPPVS